MDEEIKWYLDRICHYGGNEKKDKESYRLYGNLEEYCNFEGRKIMYDFWVNGLTQFVKAEIERKIKVETSKLKLKLEQKENIIRELVELTR